MTALKHGDRVVVTQPAVVAQIDRKTGVALIEWPGVASDSVWVNLAALEPAPESPYEDPELVPDMVIMSEDESDGRMWHYLPDGAEDSIPFRTSHNKWHSRDELPERIRPVFDPRAVPS